MTIQEGIIWISDILMLCGRQLPADIIEYIDDWKKSLNWEPKTFDDFFSLMPEEYEPTVRTATQAGMNISSGKLGIRRLVAGSELNHAIDG